MHPSSSSSSSSSDALAGCNSGSLTDLTVRIIAHSGESSHRAGSSSGSSSTSSPRVLHCMPACIEEGTSGNMIGGEHPAVPLLIVHAGDVTVYASSWGVLPKL
jgi:hypothetical protein